MAQRFVEQLRKIEKLASDQPGPYIYGIYVDSVRPLWPK
jgi:hypothetical protein